MIVTVDPALKFTVLVELVPDPGVKPSDAPLFTVIGDAWLPPTKASVPTLTVVVPV
jgi:hypothetical protein